MAPRAALNTDAVTIQHDLPRRFRQLVPAFVGVDLWQSYAELIPPLDLGAFEQAFRPDQDPGLPELLATYASALAQVADYLEQTDLSTHPQRAELKPLAHLCRRAEAQPEAISGHPRLLNHLADLLIAIDTPADAELLAFDRVFDVLCTALGQPCRVLPSWRAGTQTISSPQV